jgi:polyhydroxybutyrate depolymerase
MALRLACARPDLVAGIGVVATKLTRGFSCPRGRPRPAIFLHGTADPITPHDGSEATLSAAETIAFWGARNRCSGNLKISRIDRNRSDTTSVVQRLYTSCQATLAHYIVLGGGHGWHAGRAGRGGRLGPMSGEINAGDALVTFLRPLVGR